MNSMNKKQTGLKDNMWTSEKSFSFLLAVLSLYIFVVIPFMGEDLLAKIVFLLFFYLLLTSGIPYFLKRNKKTITFIFVVFPLILFLMELWIQTEWLQLFTDFFIVVYCGVLGYIILRRTFGQGEIDSRRIQGALVVYLLGALIFGLFYHSIFILSGEKSFHGITASHRREFLYFSFCTLTTDGYGDILPLSSLARSFSNLESLIGQLYPAILIARLVSMEFSAKKE